MRISKKRYARFRDDGSLSRQRVTRQFGRVNFRVISDDPLTTRELDLMQELIGIPPLVFQRASRVEFKRLGKFVNQVRCFDV